VTYHLQFFRQWLRDVGVEDIEADGSLDHAKTMAQVTLETLARERTSRFRPRTAYIVDGETREVLVVYRLTDAGPVELPPGSRPPVKSPSAIPRLRVANDASAAKS
jgi:hypothetical protein